MEKKKLVSNVYLSGIIRNKNREICLCYVEDERKNIRIRKVIGGKKKVDVNDL